MKRMVLALLLLALMVAPASAGVSESGTFTLHAPVPCLTACPYWIGDLEDSCDREPLTVPGSWDEHRVVAPQGAVLLVGGLRPHVDFDLFLCRVHDPGTPSERYEYVTTSNSLIWPCRIEVGWVGCEEWVEAVVEPGATYVLRGYNWLDVAPAPGEWWFCDSFACPRPPWR